MKVKISSKGQISIPVIFRRKLQVKPGDEISIIESGDNLIISSDKTCYKEDLAALYAKLRGTWRDMDLDGADYVREIRKGGTRDAW